MPYEYVGDFPVDVMMIQFDLFDWNYNDDSGLYESIDLIKDYFNIMTERLRHRILDSSPSARIRCQVGIIEKVERNQCLHCYRIHFHYQTYLAMKKTATTAAWWRQWRGGGGDSGVVAVAVGAAW
jgi:hypothetical protein